MVTTNSFVIGNGDKIRADNLWYCLNVLRPDIHFVVHSGNYTRDGHNQRQSTIRRIRIIDNWGDIDRNVHVNTFGSLCHRPDFEVTDTLLVWRNKPDSVSPAVAKGEWRDVVILPGSDQRHWSNFGAIYHGGSNRFMIGGPVREVLPHGMVIDRMNEAKVIVTACGVTLLEALALEKPIMVIPTAADQAANYSYVKTHGLALDYTSEGLDALLADQEQRHNLITATRGVIDREEVVLLAQEILQCIG